MMPELGRIGPLALNTYTVLLDLAILIGLGALTWRSTRLGQEPVRWIDAGLVALVGGILGGRLAHGAIHWAYFSNHPGEILLFWRGGLDWHGAIAGGLIGLEAGCKWRQVSFRGFVDVLAAVLPAGAMLTYTGCLMTACGYGYEVPNLSDYPSYLVAELPDIYGILAPRLISQVYGVAWGALVLITMMVLGRFQRAQGFLFWPSLTLLGVGSFGIGFTLGDPALMVGPLRIDQVLDLAIVIIGLAGTISVIRPVWPFASWRPNTAGGA